MKYFFAILFAFLIGYPGAIHAQLRFTGHVIDSEDKQPLAFVNIGIKQKNIGTVTSDEGSFTLDIPNEFAKDTITFSMIGYEEYNLPLQALERNKIHSVDLVRKKTMLNEVTVVGQELKEQRFGIKRRGLLIHFADGMFNKDDSFEIGQLIKLGSTPAKLTSLNLYVLEPMDDSITFRINFYRYLDGQPAERVVEKNIVQRKAIKKGWLQFNLADFDIKLSGDVVATLEFMPQHKQGTEPISYEVKLGGTSKSFYRRSSLGTWSTPPHHYCLNVTALVNEGVPEPLDEDSVSAPAFVFPSDNVKDNFSVFVNLPEDYEVDTSKRYPVLFHLDGNAYFDHIKASVDERSNKKHGLSRAPIVIGIGYENAYLMDSLRVRDYTYPKALPIDSFTTSGGADRFYAFITKELIPYIDENYRTDTTSRTIMGHSFGGYFVLYALLRDRTSDKNGYPQFNCYVSASPSLGYRDGYIVHQLEEKLKVVRPYSIEQKVYLTMGGREIDHNAAPLLTRLKNSLYEQKDIIFRTKVYRNTDHLGAAVPTFEDAIHSIYE